MRTREEIENEIATTEDKLTKLKEELKRCGEKWKPKYGERYYTADPTCIDFYSDNRWENDHFDNRLFCAGLIFPTLEEAAELGKRMYYSQMFASMSDVTDEDWKKPNKPKYCVMWGYLNNLIEYDSWMQSRFQGVAYFFSEYKCREAVHAMIADIGEDNFKKYVLGVSDNDT